VVLAVTTFGVHRDEFLYFSMGNHLRLWHMDFPPAIAILGSLAQSLFGHTVAAARVFPAIEGTILIVLAGLFARELGGGRFAQGFAAFAVLAAPLFQRNSTLFQPVVLDQICWTLALLAIARIARARSESRDTARAWLLFGVAIGLGLLCKFSIFFLCASVLAAVLATSTRRELLTPWPWIAVLIMLVIGSPSIVGQITLHYPVVAQMQDLNATQLRNVSIAEFLTAPFLYLGPVSVIVVIAGTVAMLVWPPLKPFAVVSLSCIFAFALLLYLHGKPYYIGPIYPALFAAGGVVLEHMSFPRHPRLAPASRWGIVAVMTLLSIITLPLGVPILSVTASASYAARIGGGAALRTNRGLRDRLPQDYADMLGWRAEAAALQSVYRSLPPAEQRQAVIATGNYGEAGAAEFYQSEFGLPPVVTSAGSFWFFGPGTLPGNVLIALGSDRSDLEKGWTSVREVRHLIRPWSVSEERDVPIYVATEPRMTLQQIWPSLAGRQ
jgi:4-amino-4-deoxy-L-arabinose transferase-like glycosyltransferase